MTTGILETRDVLEAVNELAIIIVKEAKDGIQINDVGAIIMKVMASDEVKAKLSAAVTNIMAVPSELADIDAMEAFELAKTQLSYVPRILEALK